MQASLKWSVQFYYKSDFITVTKLEPCEEQILVSITDHWRACDANAALHLLVVCVCLYKCVLIGVFFIFFDFHFTVTVTADKENV